MNRSLDSRFEGALAGLAACDASGRHVAAAEALAASLLERRGFDSNDQARRFEGLEPSPLASVAPLAMYLLHDAARAKDLAGEIAQNAGEPRESADACRYFTGLMIGALRGDSKSVVLGDLYSPVYNYWFFRGGALTKRVDAIARGVYQNKERTDFGATDQPADILETALWALQRTSEFRSGSDEVAALGGAVELRGAVYGQLAGALYGINAVGADGRERQLGVATKLLGATGQGIRHFTSWDQLRT